MRKSTSVVVVAIRAGGRLAGWLWKLSLHCVVNQGGFGSYQDMVLTTRLVVAAIRTWC